MVTNRDGWLHFCTNQNYLGIKLGQEEPVHIFILTLISILGGTAYVAISFKYVTVLINGFR